MTWTRGPTIGRGSTATVSIAATPAGDIFAVKSTDLASSALLKKEESFISQLSSPYVIRCLGSDVTSDDDKSVYNLFLEYSSGGSLSDLIGKRGGALDEKTIRFYSKQLLTGLEYLHRSGLVHCDIKGQNILVGGGGAGVKIGDFGCAKWAATGGVFSGTPAYMAPEASRGEEQSFPADVWSVGCTVIEMATGCHPWPEMKDPAAALYRIAFSDDVPEPPSWFSGEARDFVGKCLVRDPRRRWTAAELLRHPFLDSAEEGCGGIGEGTRRSPTSVTDQDFWDAVEVSECLEIPTEMMSSSPTDSPNSRIRALVGGSGPTRWDFGEDQEWVTVRANEFEECQDLHQDFGDFIEEEEISYSDLVLVEDYSWFDFFIGVSGCAASFTQKQSVKYFVYSEFLDLKIMLIEFFLHPDQVSLLPFLPLDFCYCYSNDLLLPFLKDDTNSNMIVTVSS
ncbi:mitogen-activated protein kinase kinase kinase 18 [Salvia miltiorrhiza]|uniref:mitogen-activated protein kinase kinase kinase 18 n=1 Tax=Salvia miltiorrhiza TaxID=226208 RepID=UPI0025AC6CD7|nr:mitogen-activated protein kinase kinase kinase 18 [Salvia miltiorrhiza]